MTAARRTRTGRTSGTNRAAKRRAATPSTQPRKTTKLDRMVAMLSRSRGASLAELVKATGWQPHSVRGALAGALKRKGHVITSEKADGRRRYRIGAGDGKRG